MNWNVPVLPKVGNIRSIPTKQNKSKPSFTSVSFICTNTYIYNLVWAVLPSLLKRLLRFELDLNVKTVKIQVQGNIQDMCSFCLTSLNRKFAFSMPWSRKFTWYCIYNVYIKLMYKRTIQLLHTTNPGKMFCPQTLRLLQQY